VVQIIAIGAEVTALPYISLLVSPRARLVWVGTGLDGLVLVNALQVGNFGESEYWFAMIKVVAIIVFIAVGISLMPG